MGFNSMFKVLTLLNGFRLNLVLKPFIRCSFTTISRVPEPRIWRRRWIASMWRPYWEPHLTYSDIP